MEFDLEAFGEGHEGPSHDHPQPTQEELMREFATLRRAGPLAACDVMSQFHKEGVDLWVTYAPSIGFDLDTPEGWMQTQGFVLGLLTSLVGMGPAVSAHIDATVMSFHRLTHVTKSAVQWCRENDVSLDEFEKWEARMWEQHFASKYSIEGGE